MSTPPQDPGVYISPAQTYSEVRELSRKLDKMDGKIDMVLRDSLEIKSEVSDHEGRLRLLELGETPRQQRTEARLVSLETRQWPLPTIGAVTGVAGVATAVVALFVR
ncbi:hypothetical protein ABZ568_00335 [Streptomyces olindensis]|uniref:DUF3618 domain-containing protein n=1 Tax=Streptomyces olindensis TaxID=358823 RepID=A0ABV2XM32_9ACTN